MSRLLCLLLLFSSLPALAATVYKSVDARGLVSFSDQPPVSGTLVEVLDYSDSAPTPSAVDTARFEAMREVTDRMAADRRERDATRLELRKLQLENEAAQVQIDDYYNTGYVGYGRPGYGRVYNRRPHRPGFRPPGIRPPGVRPPVHRPYPIGRPAITSQYPAKLIRQHYTGAAARVFNPQPRDLFYR